MKTSLLIITTLISLNVLGQYELEGNYDITFDNIYGLNHLTIDTISNTENIWQICIPNKEAFLSAYSSPKVIMTDSLNSYPVSDTSVFYIKNIALGGGFGPENPHTVILAGQYSVDSDSLTDFGKIEFSPDNGRTWIDMLKDTVPGNEWYYDWYWDSFDKPVLTGHSGEWKSFWVHLAALGNTFDINYGDTVIYKFSFISDSIDSEKSGLMYDNLHFEDWVEGSINEQEYGIIPSYCYPNPTDAQLTIKFSNINKSTFELMIYDLSGKKINHLYDFISDEIILDTRNLRKGLFYYKLLDTKNKNISNGNFIKK
jgi:hypothetical protein